MSENNRQNQSKETKGGANKLLIVIIGAIIALLLVAVIVILIINGRNKKAAMVGTEDQVKQEEGLRGVILSSENIDEIAEEMESKVPAQPGYYTVAMTTGWHFENSKSVSYDAYVKNNPDNSNDVYFDLFLKDDLENPIYESPIISLGAELNQILLNRELQAGEYDCVMKYHLVDENQNTVDTLTVTQKVIIEN